MALPTDIDAVYAAYAELRARWGKAHTALKFYAVNCNYLGHPESELTLRAEGIQKLSEDSGKLAQEALFPAIRGKNEKIKVTISDPLTNTFYHDLDKSEE